ncbi:MAG: hypothetical protein J0H97_23310 [Alphaproteobacteria bacterium]|jgi:hypothetical protein|nr:hypothetical protein [Alphaproteobacteria bacterium]
MRVIASLAGVALVAGLTMSLSTVARADDLLRECMVTASQKTCECIIARIPADQRENAILGLRKSNQSVSVSGNLLNPSNLSPQEMQGLNAVVAAQAYCM